MVQQFLPNRLKWFDYDMINKCFISFLIRIYKETYPKSMSNYWFIFLSEILLYSFIYNKQLEFVIKIYQLTHTYNYKVYSR